MPQSGKNTAARSIGCCSSPLPSGSATPRSARFDPRTPCPGCADSTQVLRDGRRRPGGREPAVARRDPLVPWVARPSADFRLSPQDDLRSWDPVAFAVCWWPGSQLFTATGALASCCSDRQDSCGRVRRTALASATHAPRSTSPSTASTTWDAASSTPARSSILLRCALLAAAHSRGSTSCLPRYVGLRRRASQGRRSSRWRPIAHAGLGTVVAIPAAAGGPHRKALWLARA